MTLQGTAPAAASTIKEFDDVPEHILTTCIEDWLCYHHVGLYCFDGFIHASMPMMLPDPAGLRDN